MNITEIERGLTKLAAGWLGGTVDAQVFRGEIPAGAHNASSVRINYELPETYRYDRVFAAQVFGRFDDRDDALSMIDRITTALPRGAQIVGDVDFMYIECLSTGELSTTGNDGRLQRCASVNLQIRCRPAEIKT